MDDFPAEWRAIDPPSQRSDSTSPVSAKAGGMGRLVGDRTLLVALAFVAIGLGVAAVLAALWLTAPAGDVVITGGEPDPRAAAAAAAGGGRVLASADPSGPGTGGDVTPSDIVVDVEGAVKHPGIQRLGSGARVGDAITAAGGWSGLADLTAATRQLNLAAPLTDGAQVRVPMIGDRPMTAATPHGSVAGASAAPSLVDLNHADQAGLESLPGIGPVTAGKIIDARSQALFASVDDLVSRDVMGQSILDKIRELVTVTP